jgi:predicted  nucleic acid-binding Zn-ribbon protein
MVGAVVSTKETERLKHEVSQLRSEVTELKTQVDRATQQLSRIEQILSAAAQLNKRMPKFQQQLGEAIGTVLQRINNIDSKSPRPK